MKLTTRQIDVLETMLANENTDDGELVYERGQCWLGYEQIDSRILFSLVRLMAISLDQYSQVGGFERYHINDTGKDLLRIASGGKKY